jgi:hypothetical protein
VKKLESRTECTVLQWEVILVNRREIGERREEKRNRREIGEK